MAIKREPVFNGKEMLTIKEFATFAGVEQTTLRYWDEIGLITPAARNPENNYRYYSPLQVSTVNFVNVLSGLGVPLKTIGAIEKERTPQTIVELIERQESKLDMEMRRLRESYSIIHRLRDLIKMGLDAEEGEITVMHLEDTHYIHGPRNVWGEEPSYFETFMEFCKQAPSLRINLNYSIAGMHESVEAFMRAPSEPDYYVSVDPMGYDKRPAGEYLVGYARGYYGEFGDLPQRMMAYAEENNLILSGPVYAAYLHDEICMHDHDRYLARLSVAAKPEKRKTNAQASRWMEVT